MEIIVFENAAYQKLLEKIDKIAEHVLNSENTVAIEPQEQEAWLDNVEAAAVLKISTRTLQRLRKDKLISYTMLRGKCLYKLSDIQKGLNERIVKSIPRNIDDLLQQYDDDNGTT